jgi:hypothetical protein
MVFKKFLKMLFGFCPKCGQKLITVKDANGNYWLICPRSCVPPELDE